MTDPQRLSEHGADDLERALLTSARGDTASEQALERALAVFSGDAAAGSEGGSHAATAEVGLTLVQWAGIGVAVTTLAVIGAQLLPERRDPGLEPPRATARVSVRNRASSAAASASPAAAPGPRALDVTPRPASPAGAVEQPAAEQTHRRLRSAETRSAPHSRPGPTRAPQSAAENSQPSSPSPAAFGSEGSSLAAEVRLLEQARAAIAARDPERSLQLLDRHLREFSAPALEPEATVLRVEALAAQGDWLRARQVAGRFLAGNPSGAAARRIRELLAGAPIP